MRPSGSGSGRAGAATSVRRSRQPAPAFRAVRRRLKRLLRRLWPEGFVTSQFHVCHAMKILGTVAPDIDGFVAEFVAGKRVAEIGGGYITLAVHLKNKGAMAAVSTDIAPGRCGSNPDFFHQANIRHLPRRIAALERKLCGGRPDVIVGTSLFGGGTLSRKATGEWLTLCTKIVAPGGAIVVDLLLPWALYRWVRKLTCADPVTQGGFEALLDEMKARGTIEGWAAADRVNRWVIYRRPKVFWIFPHFRERSQTYLIVRPKKGARTTST